MRIGVAGGGVCEIEGEGCFPIRTYLDVVTTPSARRPKALGFCFGLHDFRILDSAQDVCTLTTTALTPAVMCRLRGELENTQTDVEFHSESRETQTDAE